MSSSSSATAEDRLIGGAVAAACRARFAPEKICPKASVWPGKVTGSASVGMARSSATGQVSLDVQGRAIQKPSTELMPGGTEPPHQSAPVHLAGAAWNP